MVIADHAFIDPGGDAHTSSSGPVSMNQADTPPVLISETPIVLGIEDDRNFEKLPALDQQLHTWAMSAHSVRPTAEMAAECFEAIRNAPLGDIPLVVVNTANENPKYSACRQLSCPIRASLDRWSRKTALTWSWLTKPGLLLKQLNRWLAQ
jgi:hypothetical protein